MRSFYKLVSSNYRANKNKGQCLTNRSYPIWCESPDHLRFQWASYIVSEVFNDEVLFIKGENVEV